MKIYCAGPLFTQSERDEIAAVASTLEKGGFDVFLPHRDGLEFRDLLPRLVDKGVAPEKANELVARSIFSLDAYHVLDSDGLVFNLNGRVPDEGTMVEAGIAWASGKAIVAFKDDPRSLMEGSDNPMVCGLSDFVVAHTAEEVLESFRKLFLENPNALRNREVPPPPAGEKICQALKTEDVDSVCELLIAEFGK
ncbi:nucleoside 2-deoxyribosyltransferase [Pelagicoccus albus]|uniref:Nucleoside 2-deoxyribosyltransferase n=1 Tax=Pelagicoccus albus TaxID=415222 RepID=A0A7X1B6R6_9BACT|nr:nucleoside 2-deoxyribosyltransferase [Pelagicoccus albus]MBC2606685.1 nucleoside 2-deoxyribosyltransferase [Pelagicoccus albus]